MPRAERLAAALVVGVLIGLLVVTAGAARRLDRENAWQAEQLRTLRETVTALTVQLAQKPAERIVVQESVVRVPGDCGHDTPISIERSCWGH
jgi:hypothetical protein